MTTAAAANKERIQENLARLESRYQAEGKTRESMAFGWARHSLEVRNDLRPLRSLRQLDHRKAFPVDIDQFLEDTDFMGYMQGEFGVWDAHRDRVRLMNPDVVCGEPPVVETALGGASGTGKALDVNTPVPVPGGWKRMGDLAAGDAVYDERGVECTVLMAHDVLHDRQCYHVVFDDGSDLVADAEHLWLTETKSNRINKTTPVVKTTKDISDTLRVGRHVNHVIPLCEPLQGVEITRSMLDPYVLGAWLGDGAAASGIIYTDDPGVVDELSKHALVEKKSGKYKWRVFGLNKSLRHWNLLNNKHVPARWLRASVDQRTSLLQGLMDTDGSVDKRQGRCEFYTSSKDLADSFLELCTSLGIKAVLKDKKPVKAWGKEFDTSWRVGFTPPRGMKVFRLERKQRFVKSFEYRTSAEIRVIKEVSQVESRPVRCITVDSPSKLYLAGKSMVPTHNTTLAWINVAYQFYLLSCFRNPQRAFGLAPITPIVFTMQSISQTITKLVIYNPFRQMLLSMPYVKRWCKWDKQREGQIDFADNVHIIPVLARGTSLQGQAVIGGILDELSFMVVIEASKQVSGPRGQGGKFDQAEEVFTQTMNRRSRSFGRGGISVGSVCAMSNTSYRGDFMDRHLQFIEKHHPEGVIGQRLQRHKLEPDDVQDVAMGRTITIQVGTDYRSTRIITEDEQEDEGATLVQVPARYKLEFMLDPDKALREIVGIASAAIRPFIRQRNKMVDAFNRGRDLGLESYVDIRDVDLTEHGMPQWDTDKMPDDKDVPRYFHVDLSKNRDRCGIAVVKPFGMVNVEQADGTIKTVPSFAVECAITLTPSGNVEVEPAVIRDWIIQLASEHGFTIGGVSYDGYQSQESQQVLKRARIYAVEISVDRKMEQYEYFRSAIYEDRVAFCPSDMLMDEMIMLEYDSAKDKVDHPPKGSKDLADAVCGAIYNCSQQRHYRNRTVYTDTEGERVRAKGSKERPKTGTRPKSGTKKTRRRRRSPAEALAADVTLPRNEQEVPDRLPEGAALSKPPKWWTELHGEN